MFDTAKFTVVGAEIPLPHSIKPVVELVNVADGKGGRIVGSVGDHDFTNANQYHTNAPSPDQTNRLTGNDWLN